MTKTVPDRLRDAAALFEARNAEYGSNYEMFGTVMHTLFPKGMTINTPDEWRRMVLFVHMITKTTRYSQSMRKGHGHADSLADLAVYALMAAETDDMATLATEESRRYTVLADKLDTALAADRLEGACEWRR